ncbi:MAG: SIS domain-containing protein, partial [candidate division NC10 bacterium]|nr:SIS domain-containing protein [candidate division NC10 bacterium]
MMNPVYYEAVIRLLGEIQQGQASAIDRAADVIFSSLAADGVLHVFGSGH